MMSDGFLVRKLQYISPKQNGKKWKKMEKTQKVPGRIYVP